MKQSLLIAASAVVLLAMLGTLSLGLYGMATGHYILYTGGSGQHRGWDDGQTRGRGQGWRWSDTEGNGMGIGDHTDLSPLTGDTGDMLADDEQPPSQDGESRPFGAGRARGRTR